MRTSLCLMSAVLLLAAGSAAGLVMVMPMMPIEEAVAAADLIVHVSSVQQGDKQTLEAKLPEDLGVQSDTVVRYTAKVEKVLGGRDAGKAGDLKEVTFLAEAPGKPQNNLKQLPPGAGARPVRPPVNYRGQTYPHLANNGQYVLLLRKLPDGKGYFLPSDMAHWRGASEPYVKQIERIGDVEKWTWGKADASGLQVAILPRTDNVPLNGDRAVVNVSVVVRNSGDKPVRFSVHPRHKPLMIVAMDAEGGVVQANPYENSPVYGMMYQRLPAHMQEELAPGQMAFLGTTGLSANGVIVQLPLKEGDWKFYAVFQGSDDDGGRAWTGEVRSKPLELPVKQLSRRGAEPNELPVLRK